MKKLILILLISFQASSFILAQDSQQTEQKVQYVYCSMEGVLIPVTNKMEVWLDYGEPLTKQTKPTIFNSMIDALNTMVKQGWELVTAYAHRPASHTVTCYILRKEIKQNENNLEQKILEKLQ